LGHGLVFGWVRVGVLVAVRVSDGDGGNVLVAVCAFALVIVLVPAAGFVLVPAAGFVSDWVILLYLFMLVLLFMGDCGFGLNRKFWENFWMRKWGGHSRRLSR